MAACKLHEVLTQLDERLSQDDLDKLSFLAGSVVPFDSIEGADSIDEIQCMIESQQGKERSVVLLRKFLEIIGLDRLGKKLDSVIQALDGGCSLLPPKTPHLYKICIIISDQLGHKSFQRLLYMIPDMRRGRHGAIKTPVQLFRRLLLQQTLSVDREKESIDLLCIWLGDIGRVDILQDIMRHSSQGMCVR